MGGQVNPALQEEVCAANGFAAFYAFFFSFSFLFPAPDLAWRKGIRAAALFTSQHFTLLKEIQPKSNSTPPLPAESRKIQGRTGCYGGRGGEREL